MFNFQRTDPHGCRCTDCLTGYSIPIDWMSSRQIEYACIFNIQDASGLTEKDWDEL